MPIIAIALMLGTYMELTRERVCARVCGKIALVHGSGDPEYMLLLLTGYFMLCINHVIFCIMLPALKGDDPSPSKGKSLRCGKGRGERETAAYYTHLLLASYVFSDFLP